MQIIYYASLVLALFIVGNHYLVDNRMRVMLMPSFGGEGHDILTDGRRCHTFVVGSSV